MSVELDGRMVIPGIPQQTRIMQSTIFSTLLKHLFVYLYTPKINRQIDMAQNMNNVQYVFLQNAGHLQAPPGQTYELPLSSLIGMIGMSRRNPDDQKISPH